VVLSAGAVGVTVGAPGGVDSRRRGDRSWVGVATKSSGTPGPSPGRDVDHLSTST